MTRRLTVLSLLCGSLVGILGCAGVTFYQTSDLQHRTGIKYYTAKPYLLVTHTGNKENPLKVEVVSLPDLANPTWAVYKPGWGTHEFTLKMENGILTEYNQKADTQGPETIKALTDGFSSIAAAYLKMAQGQPPPPAEPAFELFEIITEKGQTSLRRVTLAP